VADADSFGLGESRIPFGAFFKHCSASDAGEVIAIETVPLLCDPLHHDSRRPAKVLGSHHGGGLDATKLVV